MPYQETTMNQILAVLFSTSLAFWVIGCGAAQDSQQVVETDSNPESSVSDAPPTVDVEPVVPAVSDSPVNAEPQKAAPAKEDNSIEGLERRIAESKSFNWRLHNQLRHEYWAAGKPDKAMQQIEVILANSPLDGYKMDILGGHKSQGTERVKQLLEQIENNPDLPNVVAACWISAAHAEADKVVASQYLTKAAAVQGAAPAYKEAAMKRAGSGDAD